MILESSYRIGFRSFVSTGGIVFFLASNFNTNSGDGRPKNICDCGSLLLLLLLLEEDGNHAKLK